MSLRLENLKNLETWRKNMSILNQLKQAKPFKGFSLKIMILLLISVGSGIVLLLGSIAGVGILGAFHHIASIYHRQTVEASSAFVAQDLEYLLNTTLQPQKELWQKQSLDQKDVASKSRFAAAAWHYNPARRQLNLISPDASHMMQLPQTVLPFRQLVQPDVDLLPAYPGYSLPKLPENLRWNISREFAPGKAAWLVWAHGEDNDASGIWGFKIDQEQLRPQLVKLLRRLCHDNFMQIALFDEEKKLLVAVNYQGELKNISRLTANEQQTFIEKPLGQCLSGMSMQIVYTPGIFGRVPTWAYQFTLVLIGLAGCLLLGSVVYFYGLERTSTNQLQLQNDWVLNLAHSLRGACHSLGVLTEAMKANGNGDLDELHTLARRELEAMDTHCRQFLQLAKRDMKAVAVKTGAVELEPLVRTAVERVLLRYPLVEKDAVKIAALPALSLSANREAAAETLMTIIDNAIKYSPEAKQIKINAEVAENQVQLVIADNGFGISPEDAALVGTAFFRSSRSDLEGINGTGIGLYLAREACTAMGWQLQLTSDGPDQGTRVTLLIPVLAK